MDIQAELDRLNKDIAERDETIESQKELLTGFNTLSNDLTKEKTDLLEIINDHSNIINEYRNEIYFLKEIIKTFIELHNKTK